MFTMEEIIMKRWHKEFHIAKREWRKHFRQHVESNKIRSEPGRDPYDVDCVCDQQVGRFRKTDNGDCGNTRCYICHSDKFPKRELTKQEVIANISFKEGSMECWK